MSQIVFDNVTCQFKNDTKAVHDISFTINPGEFVFLVGPSGAGKTTILRLLLKEYKPQSGKIFVDDDDINKRRVSKEKIRRQIGASFQDVKILEDRTVAENVTVAMEIVGQKNQDISKNLEKVLSLVDMLDKKDLFPSQLSGGELQRVGLARALAGDPSIIFADEPTANLDSQNAWKIVSLLKDINRTGKTVIVATHNRDLYDSMGERVITLDNGRLVSDQNPADI